VADDGGRRTAIDLMANRVHAVSHRSGRLVIDAGGLDFLKYVDGGWKTSWLLGEKDEGHPAALGAGLSALAFLPVDADGDGAGSTAIGDAMLSITMRALAPQQRVSLFVNEKPAGTLEVAPASKRYDVSVPGALLHAGDNRIRLTFRSAADVAGGKRAAAAVTAIALGPAPLGPPPPTLAPAAVREVDLGGVRRRAFVPGGSSRLSFYLQIPEGAALAFALGAPTAGGQALVRVVDGSRPGRCSGRRRHQVDARAGGFGRRRPGGASIVSQGAGEIAWASRASSSRPRPPPPPARPLRPHLRLMVDTLRADKLHAWNPKTRATPNYDTSPPTRPASSGRRSWDLVAPSHASLLTASSDGHKATAHSAAVQGGPVRRRGPQEGRLPDGVFSSNGTSRRSGVDRGWDLNRNFIRESLPSADYL
jgi:hypothetical protein